MYVEKLDEKKLYELCFRILVERAHKTPKKSFELKSVKNLIVGYNSISFEMEYEEIHSKVTKTTNITANDYELFVNNNYNITYSKILKQYLSELFNNYTVPQSKEL